MQSSVVANATRSMAQRKRGKYVMMEFRALKTRFGAPLAKQILTEKKQQQENKDVNDPLTYWMKHPDVASEAQRFKQICFGEPFKEKKVLLIMMLIVLITCVPLLFSRSRISKWFASLTAWSMKMRCKMT